jgi:glycosyltransferase involved in cell wall biosynthesis
MMVDDDSTDLTAEMTQQFARFDRRFRVEKNPERLGLVGNWNCCIELSRGKWIKLLFQDDLLLPGCLEHMLAGAGRPGNWWQRLRTYK